MRSVARPIRVSTCYLPREKYVLSVTPGLIAAEKTAVKNNSRDSGVYGLRDSPNSAIKESPTRVHETNSGPKAMLTLPPKTATASTCNSPRATSRQEFSDQLPEYIVDPKTRTTYLKGKFLGKGGFARVHELIDLTTNQVFAGKIIPRSRIVKPHNREKIVREIDLHRTLCHRHVVRFERYFEDADNVYIILEYCPRKSLVHVLKHRSVLDENEARFYMRQLAEACEYIHAQRIVHRDLKLGNMFISEEAQVKVGDFGLATRLEDEKKATICGTPNYIAPEVLDKLGHGFEADRWAMGCIMYAMLVGQPPFETDTLHETYRRIRANQYTLPAHLSASAADLICRLLDPVPCRRPTPSAMLQHRFFTGGATGGADSGAARVRATVTAGCAVQSVGHTAPAPATATATATAPANNSPHGCVDNRTAAGGGEWPLATVVATAQQSRAATTAGVAPFSPPPATHHCHHLRQSSAYGATNAPHAPLMPIPAAPPASDSLAGECGGAVWRCSSGGDSHQMSPHTSPFSASSGGHSVFRRFSTPTCLKAKDKESLSLRQKLTSVFRSPASSSLTASSGGKRRTTCLELLPLCNILSSCIDSMPAASDANPCAVPLAPLFVTKWIDYSNKYGFGFQLSDRSVGVLFNDATRVLWHTATGRVEFVGRHGKLCMYQPDDIPALLTERFVLLRYFGQYMEENLTDGGITSHVVSPVSTDTVGAPISPLAPPPPPPSAGEQLQQQERSHMCRWLRTDRAIIMQLSTGTIQVNFFSDHTKLVFWCQPAGSSHLSPLRLLENGVAGGAKHDGAGRHVLVTYINSDRLVSTFRLPDLASGGCARAVRDRLQHTLAALRQFAHTDAKLCV